MQPYSLLNRGVLAINMIMAGCKAKYAPAGRAIRVVSEIQYL